MLWRVDGRCYAGGCYGNSDQTAHAGVRQPVPHVSGVRGARVPEGGSARLLSLILHATCDEHPVPEHPLHHVRSVPGPAQPRQGVPPRDALRFRRRGWRCGGGRHDAFRRV